MLIYAFAKAKNATLKRLHFEIDTIVLSKSPI